jgi:hypothetical protein
MHAMLLAFALQLRVADLTPPAAITQAPPDLDSQRVVERARGAQAQFERARRTMLPWTGRSDGRCDAYIGRFCWWYDESSTALPKEPEAIARRRATLLAELDSLGTRLPSDDWIAGIRVYYHVEARQPARADSVARGCRGSAWWCGVLVAFAARSRGDPAAADSAYVTALALMSDAQRCAWRDISTLLPGDARERYEHLSCDERIPIEERYWMLSAPRLSARANEWRTEFFGRRFVATLLARATTPYRLSWGDDEAEINLRYGWPVGWSRVQPSLALGAESSIVGHDLVPSFPYSPREELLDSLASGGDDGWDFADHGAPSRVSLPAVSRVVPVQTQLARFRRGDSTLLVAAFRAEHDSLLKPTVALAAALPDGRIVSTPLDSLPGRTGQLRLRMAGDPRLAGVELSDSSTGTLARSRVVYAPRHDSLPTQLSDLLLFHFRDGPASTLDSAAAGAVVAETVSRSEPLGVYWETYGLADDGDQPGTEVTVERIDHGLFRTARQRLGLADADSPLRIRWSDARTAVDGVAARAVSLDLGSLPGGRYRITLTVSPAGRPAAASAREIELIER